MVAACRREVSIGARRNHSRDGARVIQCRVAARRMHRTALALVSKFLTGLQDLQDCVMYPVNPENRLILS